MKRRSFLFLAGVLLLAVLLASCSFGGITQKSFVDGKNAPQLDPADIESVTLSAPGSETHILFTAEQIEHFAALFSASTVKIIEGATTPDYVVTVTLKNGTEFHLDDSENDLEVYFSKIKGKSDFTRNNDIKISNDELIHYLKDTLGKESP